MFFGHVSKIIGEMRENSPPLTTETLQKSYIIVTDVEENQENEQTEEMRGPSSPWPM